MSEIGRGVLGYRWEGYDHAALYEMVRIGAVGASVISRAEPAWSEVATLLTESGDRIDQLQREVGVSWEGAAATTMAGSVSPLSQWVRDTSTAAGETNSSLTQIADGFSRASYSMPEPVRVPSRDGGIAGDFAGIVAGMVDEDSAEYRARDAKQQAVELMNAYTVNNDDSVATAGTFTEPPRISTGAGEPGGPGGRAGGVIDGPAGGAERAGDADGSGGPRGSGNPRGTAGGDVGAGAGNGSGGSGSSSASLPTGQDLPAATTAPQSHAPTPARPHPAPTTSVPFPPVTGVLTEPPAGRYGNGGGPPGPVGGVGTPRGPGVGLPGRGGAFGAPAPVPENALARGATPGGVRGAGPGFGPLGTGAKGEEDKERTSPEYLRAHHEDFWDDTPPVAPPVIGDDG